MSTSAIAPYGSWKSPITSDLIAAATIRFGDVSLDGGTVTWSESRPWEQGRLVVARRAPDGTITDINPAPYNARTRAHEYGGAAFVVDGGTLFFANFADQRLYRQDAGAAPLPLSPAVDLRYADGVMDRRRHRIIAVREDHTGPGEAVNTLAAIDSEGDERGGTVLASGFDFFSTPRLSANGARLAWLCWNHPNMPWDGCELWLADLDDAGAPQNARRIAGGISESIFQPEWAPDGTLYFVSDRTGWWNMNRWRDDYTDAICPMEAEFGRPQWAFGISAYAVLSAQQLICAYVVNGEARLALLDTASGQLTPVATPYTDISHVHAANGQVVFIGGAPAEPYSLVLLDLTSGKHEVIRRAMSVTPDPGYVSTPRAIEFPTANGLTAHAFYYPPHNRDFSAPAGELPPLHVKAHGGPTGSTSTTLSLGTQYWTSRGFAVLDVNYGGSTGYGTAYRRRLNGQWGIVDVDDVVHAARYCVEHGLADSNRLCIAGGSAGGFTTLAVLTFRTQFKAGASHYGVSDLEALARDTHKFESRYLDSMIGPYPARRDLYLARSPIYHTDRLHVPLILLQGLEDKVVPPNQAEIMFEAVKRKGLPVAYVPFEGEQHGFRQAKNIKRALDAEFYFYAKVFGFTPADPIEPVPIENLPQ
ncbi:MAG: S9 family peptidase [Chloroflexi bacterium]|nr:S9 family peptidase [Chloroflexota bacterium]